MREKAIETAIRAYVKANGGINAFTVKLHADAMQGKSTLDLLGSYRGRPFLVEVKRPDGVTSLMQTALVKRFKAGGYVSGVVASVKEFVALFEEK